MKEGDEGKVNQVRQWVFLHTCIPTPCEWHLNSHHQESRAIAYTNTQLADQGTRTCITGVKCYQIFRIVLHYSFRKSSYPNRIPPLLWTKLKFNYLQNNNSKFNQNWNAHRMVNFALRNRVIHNEFQKFGIKG